jgi:hypothetical protein
MGKSAGLGQSFAPLRPNQQQVLGNLNRVREMVTAEMSRLDQQRVNEFLNACSEGNEYRIKKVSCIECVSTKWLMLASVVDLWSATSNVCVYVVVCVWRGTGDRLAMKSQLECREG